MSSPVSRRLLRRGLVAGTAVLILTGGAAALVLLHAPGNVSHPDLQFTRPAATPPPPPHKQRAVQAFQWPWYGRDGARTHFLPGSARLRPPLRVGWRYDDRALLEFPPVLYGQTLFFLDDNGAAKAINTLDGKVRWNRKVGTLAASSPALAVPQRLLLMSVLSTSGQTPGPGRFVAVSMQTGRILWSRPLTAGSESSPIVHGQTVYFGDQSGALSALRVKDGHLDWIYHAAGAIKGGPAFVGGALYFGDYSGHAYAIRARDGHQIWAVGTNGARFGFGSGQFYSSAAVAYGRVYMGNTDGRVYSFGARDGALAWATGTGAYVYASAAIANAPGLGPTVYLGSYDGNFYALDARSGAVRWRHNAGGKISGSATIIGNVVYYSDLGSKTTAGLDLRTGRQVFAFPDGIFAAVIADDTAVYLAGRSMLYQLLPNRTARTGHTPSHHSAHRHRQRAGAGGRSRHSARKRG